MFKDEVLFPGDMPDDPVEMMRRLPPHRVPERNLVIDGDPQAIARMEVALGIAGLLEDEGDLPVIAEVTHPRTKRAPHHAVGNFVLDIKDNDLDRFMQPV